MMMTSVKHMWDPPTPISVRLAPYYTNRGELDHLMNEIKILLDTPCEAAGYPGRLGRLEALAGGLVWHLDGWLVPLLNGERDA